MTIKKLAIIALYITLSFIFLTLTCGEDGFLVTRGLEKRYEELEKRSELYKVEIETLENQIENSKGDGLKDLAHFIGFEKTGEKVFYFDSSDEDVKNDEVIVEESEHVFTGMPKLLIAFLSLLCGMILFLLQTLLHYLLSMRVGSKHFFDNPTRANRAKKERRGSYDDIDF